MTPEEIEKLSDQEVLDVMEREGLPVEHSLFATIHHRGPNRPDGFSEGDLDEIAEDLQASDVARWKAQLREHFAKRTTS